MKILALYNDQKQSGEAIEALNSQGTLRDEVDVEVVETVAQPDPQITREMPNVAPVAPTPSGGSIPAMGVLAQPEKAFAGFDLSEEEQAFLERGVRDGGQLLRVQTETLYQPQVETILRQHEAQMVHTSS